MEVRIGYSLGVARKGPQELPGVIHIPDLGFAVGSGRQKKVAGVGEEA